LFYPQVGTILSYIGAIAGFLAIYLMPVLVHLKRIRTDITNPLLARAIHENELGSNRQASSPLASPNSTQKRSEFLDENLNSSETNMPPRGSPNIPISTKFLQ